MTDSKTTVFRRGRIFSDECRQIRDCLPDFWLGELGENTSSSIARHLCRCRSCMEVYIALHAAADMAAPPVI